MHRSAWRRRRRQNPRGKAVSDSVHSLCVRGPRARARLNHLNPWAPVHIPAAAGDWRVGQDRRGLRHGATAAQQAPWCDLKARPPRGRVHGGAIDRSGCSCGSQGPRGHCQGQVKAPAVALGRWGKRRPMEPRGQGSVGAREGWRLHRAPAGRRQGRSCRRRGGLWQGRGPPCCLRWPSRALPAAMERPGLPVQSSQLSVCACVGCPV